MPTRQARPPPLQGLDDLKTAALIVAAGRGERADMGPSSLPKQYRPIGGLPVLARAVDAFARSGAVDAIQVVIRGEHRPLYDKAVGEASHKLLPPVTGRETRQESVCAGLEALAGLSPERVLVHDAARPFVSGDVIGRVSEALSRFDAVLPALPVIDTLKRGENGLVTASLDRAGLWAAQTPQGFRFAAILAAHRAAAKTGRSGFTDDTQLIEWQGGTVRLVQGSPRNIKLTTAQDFDMAEQRMFPGGMGETRTGFGFDVHAFCPGDHVWLCGVRVPHGRGLDGHSDADVGLHALTDALLGAIGDGDIGAHFPPGDPKWKGAASHLFLADAVRRVAALGGRVVNVDLTLICEAPKIGPHRESMRERIAEILVLEKGRVGVKATTSEKLGFTGRGEGIAANAVATVWLPRNE
ncbi:MAG: bifunctional 2-C-methyl-D-erythritol 4-phosphate cytidylyltransferase/2-C-methyl-D-erythritol 2,4-cyclodiphosphate synthase [Hyphomicrobiales bacterium]